MERMERQLRAEVARTQEAVNEPMLVGEEHLQRVAAFERAMENLHDLLDEQQGYRLPSDIACAAS